jgi:polar amino acid transport system substrate-binding protein
MNQKLKDSYVEIEKLAVTDKLTQLYNRHKIDSMLAYEKKHADRYSTSFGIIILDIDHFKNVNDTYGHNVGDTTLQTFANILLQNTREVDIVGRWGGEEFILIVHHADEKSLVKTAENLRSKIENAKYDVISYLTASLGVTIYQNDEIIDETISRADSALYDSKENGRNKVTYL